MGEWSWTDGAKATGGGAVKGYQESGSVYGAAVGGFLGFIGYASDNPGVGRLWTSQGPEQRTQLDQAAALGVLRAEWGTVGGFGWSHEEGVGRQHNAQPVGLRLRYMNGGRWTTNPQARSFDAARAAGVSQLQGNYQRRDPGASYVLNGRTFTGFDDPVMSYLAIEAEGAWGPDAVLSFRTYPTDLAVRELFAMGYVGEIPAETVYVEANVLWGQEGSPLVYQAERTILQGIGLVRADVPVVVIWRKTKRGRNPDANKWTFGVQMVPAGNAPTYAPPEEQLGAPRRGLGAAGWIGLAGLAAPVVAGLLKR